MNILKFATNIILTAKCVSKVHHDHQYTEEDEKKVDEELEELEKQVKAVSITMFWLSFNAHILLRYVHFRFFNNP